MSVSHTITGGGLVQLTGNPIEIVVTATQSRTSHKLCVRVSCEALFGSPFVEEIPPDANLISRFDISGFIDQPVEYAFVHPASGKVMAHSALAFTVLLEIGEVWQEEDPVEGTVRVVEWSAVLGNNVLRVLKGKLRANELAQLNAHGKTFASEYIEGGKFLTHLPDRQLVAPDQISKLWYLSRWSGNHYCQLNLSVVTDIKVGRMPITENLILIASGLFEFSVNPSFYGFVPDFGETVLSYTFWLSDDKGDISERRTFVTDQNYHEESCLFYYVNPLSGIDVMVLSGNLTENIKIENETSFVEIPVGSDSKFAGIKNSSVTDQRSWTLNTGPKTRKEINSLRDFLSSNVRWMVDKNQSDNLIPVYLEGSEYILYDSTADIQNFDLKILEANR